MDADPVDDHLIEKLQQLSHATGWQTFALVGRSAAVSLGTGYNRQETGKGILARFPQKTGEFHAVQPKILCAGGHDRRRGSRQHGLNGAVLHLRE